MCFSAEASFIALFICVGIAILLWNRNHTFDRWNALFILSFALIQLWEGLWWMGERGGSPYDSNVLVSLIFITLLLQPVAQSYGGWQTTGNQWLEWLFYFYVAILIYGLYLISQNNYTASKGPNGHVKWNRKGGGGIFPRWMLGVYLLGLVVPLLFRWRELWPLIVVGSLTAVWSLYSVNNSGEFGSLWCFYVVAYAVVAIFV